MYFGSYGMPYPSAPFEQNYRCYSASSIDKPHLENGDKVVMSPSALDRLGWRVKYQAVQNKHKVVSKGQVTCQAENKAVQNKQKVVSKAPSGSKEKAFSPKLDDGGIGGGPGGGDDGGGGGGGGGGEGGGFLFWGLLMLLGMVRDNESDQPYRGRKPNTKAMKAKKRRQMQV